MSLKQARCYCRHFLSAAKLTPLLFILIKVNEVVTLLFRIATII